MLQFSHQFRKQLCQRNPCFRCHNKTKLRIEDNFCAIDMTHLKCNMPYKQTCMAPSILIVSKLLFSLQEIQIKERYLFLFSKNRAPWGGKTLHLEKGPYRSMKRIQFFKYVE